MNIFKFFPHKILSANFVINILFIANVWYKANCEADNFFPGNEKGYVSIKT